MIQEDELKEGLVRLGRAVAPGDSIANEVMRKIIASGAAERGKTAPVLERILQMNRITKLAAAVLIIAGIAAMITFFTICHGGATVAWADVQATIRDAHTATFDLTIVREDTPVVVGVATVKQPGLVRIESAKPVEGISIIDLAKGRMLVLDEKAKTALVVDISAVPTDEAIDRLREADLSGLKELIEGAETELGAKEIAGQPAIGYQVAEDDRTIDIWVDAETGDALLIEILTETTNTKMVMTDIEFGGAVADGLFSTDVPEGYTPLPGFALEDLQKEESAETEAPR